MFLLICRTFKIDRIVNLEMFKRSQILVFFWYLGSLLMTMTIGVAVDIFPIFKIKILLYKKN